MRFLALLFAMALLAPAAQAQPTFSASFGPNQISPGSASTLTYTINNGSASATATGLAFGNTLPAGLTLATPAAASTTCEGSRALASLVALDGGSSISLSDGSVGAGSSCTVTVHVTGAAAGTFTNTTGDLTSSAGNSGTASASLTLSTDRPGFTKSFSPAMVPFQGRSRLTFTLDNSANTSGVIGPNFTDDLPEGMVIADPANAASTCLNGLASLDAAPGARRISYFDGAFQEVLAAGASCTISVDVRGVSVGAWDNVSSDLSSRNSSFQIVGSGRAVARLSVITEALALSTSFTDDPVSPGGTVSLEFTLRNLNRTEAVTNLAFSDDLGTALSGLAATGLPQSNVCGAGSQLSEASGVLSLTGGTLPAEGSCTFNVSVDVPTGATPGAYPVTTSAVSGDIGTRLVSGLPASDDLVVSYAPTLTQAFLTNPASPGLAVTLRLTLTNTSPASGASGLTFTNDLGSLVSGATLPANGFCGAGSLIFTQSVNGRSIITVQDANLAASSSCSFDIELNLPENLPGGAYPALSSAVTGMVGSDGVSGAPASDVLSVIDAPTLSLAFPASPVQPGASTALQFTLRYGDELTDDATAIAFTADLDAALSGLAATGLPVSACGGTLSSADGGSTLAFSGGTLTSGQTCDFSVMADLPAATASGTYALTTSSVTALVGGSAITSAPASGDLVVSAITFTKSFTDDPVLPGGTVTLEYTLRNTGTAAASNMVFTDNLTGALTGLSSPGPTQNDVCGTGSSFQVSGPSFLIFTGGSLAPGASCTFSRSVIVPAGATPDSYSSSTSALTAQIDGASVSVPAARDLLTVADPSPAVAFAQAFTPEAIQTGGVSTLTFTINNDASGAAATGLAFTASLPSGLTVAVAPNESTTCTGGTLTASGASVDYSAGSVAAGASCTVSADVTASDVGVYTLGATSLASSAGTSAATAAVLAVTVEDLSLMLAGVRAYRVLGLPTGGTYDASLGGLWTQGFTGSDAPTGGCSVYTYNESVASFAGGYECIADQNSAWPRGEGAYVYVYADDDLTTPGVQGGFPKVLPVPGRALPESGAPFSFPSDILSYTNNPGVPSFQEGWNLLANPLTAGLDWDETVRGGGLTPSIYVLDPNYFGGDFRTWTAGIGGDLPNGVLPAFQGFFAKAVAANPTLTVPVAAVVAPGPGVYGKTDEEPTPLRFELTLDQTPVSAAFVAVAPEAALGEDVFDAVRLTPSAWPRTVLSTHSLDANAVPLALNALPAEAEGELSVPLEIATEGHDVGTLQLSLAWTGNLPEGWTATLVDRFTQTSLSLTEGGSYAFDLIVPEASDATGVRATGLGLPMPQPGVAPEATNGQSVTTGDRFVLRLQPAQATASEPEAAQAFALLPPMPNPASGAVTLGYTVAETSVVSLVVYDALGRQVAVAAEGAHAPGRHEARVDLRALAPGAYVARLASGADSELRRFTVVR